MIETVGGHAAKARTLMGRLRSDVRANTLVIMAIVLIPLCGLAGSGIDTARLYVVKARLQQACDAGVLAGRKFMASDSTTLDANATDQAKKFFANNFQSGWMTTNSVSFTPSKANVSEVNGTASAVVPMTIMKMFGAGDTTLNVSCTARYDVADTDIMFVLDTTGSMACKPGGPDSCGTGTYTYTRPSTSYPAPGTAGSGSSIVGAVPGYAGSTAVATNELTSSGANISRIDALRTAVVNFYTTFKTNADTSTHVRYGFVTYSSSVNVGKAILDISPNYLVGSGGSTDKPYYQTRHLLSMSVSNVSDTANGKTNANCNSSTTTFNTSGNSAGTLTKTYDVWVDTSANNSTKICKTHSEKQTPSWQYERYQIDVSPLITGSTTMVDPTKISGQTLQWAGCVESPVDNPGQSTFVTTSLPSELNPDLLPSGATRWWPQLQDVEYNRGSSTANGDDTSHVNFSDTSLLNSGYVACGKPAKRLGEMTEDQVYNFVHATDFVPEGGTYHDIGMIWGSRLISPNGPWSNDTAAWSGRNPPNRVIVFMTDGVMAPDPSIYSMYGVEKYDGRVSNNVNTSAATLATYHNKRFLAACAAAKARNIDIWTVEIAPSASSTMQSCASTSAQALYTTTGTGLSDAFKAIAQRLAMLRLTH